MNIIECPHCLTRVIPGLTNLCPSCGKNVLEIDSDRVTHTVVTINDSEKLPDICYNCGRPSYICINLKINQPKSQDDDKLLPLLMVSKMVYFIYCIFDWFFGSPDMLFKIPICRDCKASHHKIDPRHIDFENRRIDIIVDKRFRNSLHDLKANRNR